VAEPRQIALPRPGYEPVNDLLGTVDALPWNKKVLNTAQYGIGNDESQPSKVFSVIRQVNMKSALQVANGRTVRKNRLETGGVTKTTVDTWRSRPSERCRIAGTVRVQECISAKRDAKGIPRGIIFEGSWRQRAV
jgi:hypothetical protein